MEIKHMQGLLVNGIILASKLEHSRVASVMDYFNENGINANFRQTAAWLQSNGVQLTTSKDYMLAFGDMQGETL